MFALKRNQIIITALVIMIAVAGYLNYMDSRPGDAPAFTLTEQEEIAALVAEEHPFFVEIEDWEQAAHDPAIAVSGTEAVEPEPGEAVFVTAAGESSFFVQARLNREQNRAGEQNVLVELINNENVDAEHRAQAADQMLDIQRRIERESATESMLESKGFTESYVRIGENSVDVVINKEVLTDAEVAQIEDIVRRKTGMQTNQIHISPLRR